MYTSGDSDEKTGPVVTAAMSNTKEQKATRRGRSKGTRGVMRVCPLLWLLLWRHFTPHFGGSLSSVPSFHSGWPLVTDSGWGSPGSWHGRWWFNINVRSILSRLFYWRPTRAAGFIADYYPTMFDPEHRRKRRAESADDRGWKSHEWIRLLWFREIDFIAVNQLMRF